ncbi:MAG: hypothetical protein V4478_03375 [Patescibacteria group bacterium]
MSFWDTPQSNAPVSPASTGGFWGAPVPAPSKTPLQKFLAPPAAPVAAPVPENSFWGIAKNTVLGIPNAAVSEAKKAVGAVKELVSPTPGMQFRVGENLDNDQTKNAYEAIANKQNDPIAQMTPVGLSEGHEIFRAFLTHQLRTDHPEDFPGEAGPEISPELLKKSFEAMNAPVLGTVGGADFVAENILKGKASTELMKTLAKTNTPEDVGKVLKSLNMSDDVVREFSEPLSKAKTLDEVKDVLLGSVKKSAPKQASFWDVPGELPSAEISPKAQAAKDALVVAEKKASPLAKKGVATPLEIPEQAAPKVAVPQAGGAESKTLNRLSDEAKKYATADEFIKKSDNTKLFHGSRDAALVEKEGFKVMEDMGKNAFGNGVYLSEKKADAKGYGHGSNGGVVETYVPSDLSFKKAGQADIGKIDVAELKSQGYDGVEIWTPYGKNYVVFDPSNVRTKTQLTEIYNGSKPKQPAVISFNKDGSIKGTKTGLNTKKTAAPVKEEVAFEDPTSAVERAKQIRKNPSLIKDQRIARANFNTTANEKLGNIKQEVEIRKDMAGDTPAAALEKYVIRSGDHAGQLPEVLGHTDASYLKRVKNPDVLEYAKKGDVIAKELGFASQEEAIAALEDHIANKSDIKDTKQSLAETRKSYDEIKKASHAELKADYEKRAIVENVEKDLRKEGRARADQIKAIQDHFNLENKEMQSIRNKVSASDFRTMTDEKFSQLLDEVQKEAEDIAIQRDARINVQATIHSMELKKVDNLQKALKLPDIKKMTVDQLNEFNDLLETFHTGDEFLGVRQIQTLKNTDLAGIKTRREALEALAREYREKTGKPLDAKDLAEITIGKLSNAKWLSDSSLAEKSPFFQILVDEVNEATIGASLRFHEFKEELNGLMKKARASRPRTFADKLVPVDKQIFNYLESNAEDKVKLAAKMTPQEMDAALFIQEKYAKARDYLVEQGVLKKYRENYITHTRRGFLEAVLQKDYTFDTNGNLTKVPSSLPKRFKAAFRELIDSNKQDEAYLNILNEKTGEILPLEKFFQFSMKRSGELVPTKNVSAAVENYFRTFEKKVALDSFIPKLDVYAQALTPEKMTPRGLEYDDSLKRFVKIWLNAKKGRAPTIAISPGDKKDFFLKSAMSVRRLLDLGFSIPGGLASNFGEQSATFTKLGPKYFTGIKRLNTSQGKSIIKKYEEFVGESVFKQLADSSKSIGEKFYQAALGFYSDASRRANMIHLMGAMTPEEFAKGEISVQRLAQIRREMGHWRPVEGAESVFAKTVEGKIVRQNKSWIMPIISRTSYDVGKVVEQLKNKKNPLKESEAWELIRGPIATVIAAIIAYDQYAKLRDKKERSFIETIAYKSANDMMSIIGGLDPANLLSTPRLLTFFANLGIGLEQIGQSLVTGERDSEDNLKGLKQVKNEITPSAIKQTQVDPSKDNMRKFYEQVQELDAEGRSEDADALMAKAFPDTEEGDKQYAKYKKVKEEVLAEKMQPVYDKVQKLDKDGNDEEADNIVDGLSDDEYKAYNKIRIANLVEKVRDLEKDGKTDDAQAIVDDLSDSDYNVYKTAANKYDNKDKPTFEIGEEVDNKTIIEKAFTYAKAIGTDPVTAFNRLFTNQSIRRVDNGTVIINRNTNIIGGGGIGENGWSSKVRSERGADDDQILDHTIPIQLGGADSEDNVKLVPNSVWKSYTPVENYLGKQLRDGKISKKEAQDRITKFKNGEITFDQIKGL